MAAPLVAWLCPVLDAPEPDAPLPPTPLPLPAFEIAAEPAQPDFILMALTIDKCMHVSATGARGPAATNSAAVAGD